MVEGAFALEALVDSPYRIRTVLAAARRADEHARRAYERTFSRAVKAHVKNKPNNQS